MHQKKIPAAERHEGSGISGDEIASRRLCNTQWDGSRQSAANGPSAATKTHAPKTSARNSGAWLKIIGEALRVQQAGPAQEDGHAGGGAECLEVAVLGEGDAADDVDHDGAGAIREAELQVVGAGDEGKLPAVQAALEQRAHDLREARAVLHRHFGEGEERGGVGDGLGADGVLQQRVHFGDLALQPVHPQIVLDHVDLVLVPALLRSLHRRTVELLDHGVKGLGGALGVGAHVLLEQGSLEQLSSLDQPRELVEDGDVALGLVGHLGLLGEVLQHVHGVGEGRLDVGELLEEVGAVKVVKVRAQDKVLLAHAHAVARRGEHLVDHGLVAPLVHQGSHAVELPVVNQQTAAEAVGGAELGVGFQNGLGVQEVVVEQRLHLEPELAGLVAAVHVHHGRDLLDDAKDVEQTLRYASRLAAVDAGVEVAGPGVEQEAVAADGHEVGVVRVDAADQLHDVVLGQHLELAVQRQAREVEVVLLEVGAPQLVAQAGHIGVRGLDDVNGLQVAQVGQVARVALVDVVVADAGRQQDAVLQEVGVGLHQGHGRRGRVVQNQQLQALDAVQHGRVVVAQQRRDAAEVVRVAVVAHLG
ncbi:aldo/keto reductase [Babesia caballi]|uniref:Aldo/keto reductase n=1 Tax=Babesia caballi TaxID=5871 RepID=A0AAV4LRR2_BABCB|nr:aldo/keto reductase [Babesia caballi]